MDYDDQMVYAYNMLLKIPWLLEYFQNQYPYICVDEAQDTSKIQHAIIALLASRTGNLFMVGDEDQSIYGFRAAYLEALLEFEQHHPGAKVLLMYELRLLAGNGYTQELTAYEKTRLVERTKAALIRAKEEDGL